MEAADLGSTPNPRVPSLNIGAWGLYGFLRFHRYTPSPASASPHSYARLCSLSKGLPRAPSVPPAPHAFYDRGGPLLDVSSRGMFEKYSDWSARRGSKRPRRFLGTPMHLSWTSRLWKIYWVASSFTRHHSLEKFTCHLSSYSSNKGDIAAAETLIYCETR